MFILDVLHPLADDAVSAAADALTDALQAVSPGATVHRRLLCHRAPSDGGALC